jgi:ADP-heptose:LPS heptosyltransferase
MLVAAPGRWDEACFAVPALRALMASGLGVGVLCREEQADFWRTLPGLVVVTMPVNRRPKELAGRLRGMWRAALLWEHGTAADIVALAGIPRRLGPAGRPLAKRLTHPLPWAEEPQSHRVRYYLSLVGQAGIRTEDPAFFVPADMGIAPETGTVLLSPDSDFAANHEWPLERWLEIARKLAGHGCRITVAGMHRQNGVARQLAARMEEVGAFFHADPLAGTLPLLAVHGLVVAADGSLSHLAAHAGATCVTLFGPNDPVWKRPLGKRHAVVRRHVECAPCLLPKCRLDMRCQNELEVERVWSVIRSKLA